VGNFEKCQKTKKSSIGEKGNGKWENRVIFRVIQKVDKRDDGGFEKKWVFSF